MQSIKETCPKKKVPKAEIDLIVIRHLKRNHVSLFFFYFTNGSIIVFA